MIEEELAPLVAAGELAGAVTMVWQDGHVVDASCVGWQEAAGGRPMRRDTLFRIASMSKPITSTVALMLLEEGRFGLDEPITRWAPELAEMQVVDPDDRADPVPVPAARDITFGDLLTHRAGLTYADFHTSAFAEAYADALGPQIDSHRTPDEWIAQLGSLPLVDQPGRRFHYGHATDLLGLLLARIEDAPLSDVLARRLLDPLGMVDTGFVVPAEESDRRAAHHGFDDHGRPTVLGDTPGGHALAERPPETSFCSGGQGLWSTVDDVVTFARVFVEGGSVEGARVLRPDTLHLMTSDQLTESQRAAAEVLGRHPFAHGHGFGLGVAVVTDPDTADPAICSGGVGTVGWPGAFGSWWQADPTNRSVMVLLTHSMVSVDQLERGIGLGAWDAIARFHLAGTAMLAPATP